MNIDERCDNLVLQLALWRQQLFDVAVTAEHFHSRNRDIIGPELRDLMRVIDAIGKKIDNFRKTCPEEILSEAKEGKAAA